MREEGSKGGGGGWAGLKHVCGSWRGGRTVSITVVHMQPKKKQKQRNNKKKKTKQKEVFSEVAPHYRNSFSVVVRAEHLPRKMGGVLKCFRASHGRGGGG